LNNSKAKPHHLKNYTGGTKCHLLYGEKAKSKSIEEKRRKKKEERKHRYN